MSKRKKKPSRRSLKKSPSPSTSVQTRQGLVLSVLGGKGYLVEVAQETWKCRVRGRLFVNNKRSHPIVGDIVEVVVTEEEPQTGVIQSIATRTSTLKRRFPEQDREQLLVSNIDQVMIFLAIKNPPFRPSLVDRYLVTCEANELRPVLVLNKTDLATHEEVEAARAPFEKIGVQTLAVSAKRGWNLETLRSMMEGRQTVITGPSGAGKSSILNAMQPELGLRVGEVNELTGKGRHTTTVTRLFPVAGGHVMDTPGIREFGLWGIQSADVAKYFVELREYEGACHFRNCTHTAEPKCAVKQDVKDGVIDERRYQSYVELRNELIEQETLRQGY
jgi:ribosome biogenesis GTPase